MFVIPSSSAALAAVTPGDAWSHWTWDPGVLLGLAVAAAGYAAGLVGLSRRGRRGVVVRGGQIACFAAGLVLLFIALISPVDAMSDALFSVHMSQHVVIGLIAPLLIVVGRPILVTSSAFRPPVQRELLHLTMALRRTLHIRRSSTAWALAAVAAHALAFWLFHAPAVYDAAIRSSTIHAMEHAVLFATGLAFWWIVVAIRWRERSAAAVLYLFVAGLQGGALAALLTLAPNALFDVHETTTAAWHLTPLEDQQLAGAIMWVPGGLVYAIAAAVLFVRWLRAGGVAADGVANPNIVFAPPRAGSALS